MLCVPVSGGKPLRFKDRRSPPRAHTPSSSPQATPLLRRRTRREPTVTRSGGAWSWVAGWPWVSLYRRLPSGTSAGPLGGDLGAPFLAPSGSLPGNRAAVGCWPTAGPHGAPWGGGVGRTGASAGHTYLPMHVRPSEWRAYFWWQPHCFRFCVSLSLCPSPVHALSLSVPKKNK